ncbi:MAG: hypothetical protein QOJ15_5284 [Bradyrhizobium sp.]|jgi:hypothetical protein|nr:hypothetical protein [Bradyrhizobium sp.]
MQIFLLIKQNCKFRSDRLAITLKSRWRGQILGAASVHRPSRRIGETMTAIIYNFERSSEGSSDDETERLFSALGRFTIAELLELLYVGEEPGFFELMRGLFALSEESRLILQKFLAAAPLQATTVAIDHEGRCILTQRENPIKGIAH